MSNQQRFKIGIVSGLLRHYPLDLALRLIKEAGYDGVELWGGQYHGYVWDLVDTTGQLDTARVRALRAMCDEAGLEIAGYTPEQLLYPINTLVDQVPPFDGVALRQRSIRNLELCIEVASDLGCKRMALIVPMWLWITEKGEYRRTTRGEVLEASVEIIGHFVEVAEAHGVDILFEPLVYHDSNGIATLEEARIIFDQIPSPNLQMMIDFGHVAVTAHREGIDPVDYLASHLDTFGDRIAHVHFDDNNLETDAHLAPGEGAIDLQAMTNLVVASGYQGWISAELSVLGPYALPENAERLLRDTRTEMTRLLSSVTVG